jgi:hypothetical protein
MSEAEIRDIIAAAPDWATGLASLTDLDIVELHSGHWPQFSQPAALGRAIARAVA